MLPSLSRLSTAHATIGATPCALRDSKALKEIAVYALRREFADVRLEIGRLLEHQWRRKFGYDELEDERYFTKGKRKSAPSKVDQKRMIDQVCMNVVNTLQRIVVLLQIDATTIEPPSYDDVRAFVESMLASRRNESLEIYGGVGWDLLDKVTIVRGDVRTTLGEVFWALVMADPQWNPRLDELSLVQPLLGKLKSLATAAPDEVRLLQPARFGEYAVDVEDDDPIEEAS